MVTGSDADPIDVEEFDVAGSEDGDDGDEVGTEISWRRVGGSARHSRTVSLIDLL